MIARKFTSRNAFLYDNDEDNSGDAESIVSDEGLLVVVFYSNCIRARGLNRAENDSFESGEIHYVDGSGKSNRRRGDSWLARLKSRVKSTKPQEGPTAQAPKYCSRRKNESNVPAFPQYSSNLIQRLDDLFRISSDNAPVESKIDEHSLGCVPVQTALFREQPSVPPTKIFDLRSLRVASPKGQCVSGVQSKPAISATTPSVSWRVNDWLAKSFPIKPRNETFSRKAVGNAPDNEDEILDDDGCDEFAQCGSFCSPAHYTRERAVQDEILEDDCDFIDSSPAHMESNSRAVGSLVGPSLTQDHVVSIRDLFKGAAKTESCKRASEFSDLDSSKRRKTPTNRPSHRNQSGFSPCLRSPPTRRKYPAADLLSGRSAQSPQIISGAKRLEIEITDFSDGETEAQTSTQMTSGGANFKFLATPAPIVRDEMCSEDDENASNFPEVRGQVESQCNKSWLTRLHDVGTGQGAIQKGRNVRRVRGELSRQFQRYEERREADHKLFRMKLDRGGPSAVPYVESQRPWHVQVLQKQFCGPVVVFTVRAISGQGNDTDSQPKYCNLVLSCAAMKSTSAVIAEGSILKIFSPWTVLSTSSCQLSTVLCSERFAVVDQLQLGEDVLNILGCNDVLPLPQELSEPVALGGCLQSSKNRGSIYDFPVQKPPVEQARPCLPCRSVAPSVPISDIDSWVSRPTVLGRVVKTCPRGLLLRATGLPTSSALPRWMNSLEDAAASSPSSFWCADSSGMACEIFVPCEYEKDWANILLGPSNSVIRVSELCVLGRTRRLCPKDARTIMAGLQCISGGGSTSVLRMSCYVLQVTSQSVLEYPSENEDAEDAPRPSQRLTPIRRLFDRGTRSTGAERATVLVRIARIICPDGCGGEGGELPTLEICVWDASLAQAQAPVRTILLRIAEPAQCLACAGVLSVGNTILVKDVSVEWFQADTLGGPWLELTVDGNAQVFICVPEGVEQRICGGGFGFCLPCVSFGELELLLTERGGSGACGEEDVMGYEWGRWPASGPSLREPNICVRDALLAFSGAVICVRSSASTGTCPTCGSSELRRPWIARSDSSFDNDTDGQGFSCAACESLCLQPLYVSGPVYAGLDTGEEVMLCGALLERAIAAAAAAGARRRSVEDGARLLVGREIRGVCVRRRLWSAVSGSCDRELSCKWELRAVEVQVLAS